MSAELSLVQKAGASAPAVSGCRGAGPLAGVRRRPGAELALALAATEVAGCSEAAAAATHMLDAEKLTVYHVALELQCMANTLVPSVNRVLRDQFERASLSVILNLAEGCGRVSRRQRRYHFGVARGSATECAALADVLRLRRLAPAGECFRARSLAVRCVQMTTKLIEVMEPTEPKGEVVA
jgi:four helix bundle protein